MNNKTLISYFQTYANSEELEKINRVNFSEKDINFFDISEVLRNFKNLNQISFKFGPFKRYFETIPENMPHIILKDCIHGDKHLEFILEFAKNCKSVAFIENDFDLVNDYFRKNPNIAKKFVFINNQLVNIEHIDEVILEGKILRVNINNIKLISEKVLNKAEKVIFYGTPEDMENIDKR